MHLLNAGNSAFYLSRLLKDTIGIVPCVRNAERHAELWRQFLSRYKLNLVRANSMQTLTSLSKFFCFILQRVSTNALDYSDPDLRRFDLAELGWMKKLATQAADGCLRFSGLFQDGLPVCPK